MANETSIEQNDILRRNIHSIAELQGKSAQPRSRQERIADRISEQEKIK
jgi:hypothetical protein